MGRRDVSVGQVEEDRWLWYQLMEMNAGGKGEGKAEEVDEVEKGGSRKRRKVEKFKLDDEGVDDMRDEKMDYF